ncbi:phosphoserine phosphatase SerB [Actinomyces urogenitalis]|uniref:phosphoserine phosphatase n=1 Tax=Actinomyces urogenitalis TaxID=103621 RepID=A0A2I1KVI7_9ACTO|nr:phosphoserine phosphatase SerB [Actinomyces urogenitalis]MBS5976274.1 phosphoserine phosphatase SerB [Actinomyces urogenitalis]MDK8835918.1 phosphoserine phosphatase SerB [Actinomyces urogenitalis]MDU0863494.1 phosphoserine phosphatase SerB [Actinomyces urogenitalis]MDU0873731.1 phosphoserine phosphatase SerB [Actinomyces urogenitalis]MDU1563633.1 phosphoserine phosphatase SerB [Actinomyces urogenitalis]
MSNATSAPAATSPRVSGLRATGLLAQAGPGLLVMDVDSTLIEQEVIELIAERAGTREQVAAVTARAMRGELDFAASLRERVATLRGVPETVFAEVLAEVRPTRGAAGLINELHARGCRVGVVSGGFEEVVVPLAERLGIDHVAANRLEVRDGHLTGQVLGRIVDRQEKVRCLRQWARQDGVELSRTVAVGDGANDLGMIATAGLGVAFCAKPVVVEQAPAAVHVRDLRAVLELL